MTLIEFNTSLQLSAPPAHLSPVLQALWYAGKNEWDTAHTIAQDINTKEGSWVHAYLHRVEGDIGNASYWYHRAGKPLATGDLNKEWQSILLSLLTSQFRN